MSVLKNFKPEIKLFLLVAFIAVVISVVGILIYFLSCILIHDLCGDTRSQLRSKLSEEQTESIAQAVWQTYRNEEFGFELKYPEGWKIKEDLADWLMKGVRDIGFHDDMDSETGFTVQQYSNPKKLSFNEWWNESTLVCDEQGMNCRSTVKRAAEKVIIDGLPGYKVSAEFPYFEIFTSNHERLYILYGYAASEAELETIDQILSTFRFVE